MTRYTLVRSRRKTIAIHITKDAAVEVRAPMKTPEADIDAFVLSKEAWIISNISKLEKIVSERAAFSLNYEDTATLRGKSYPIRARDGAKAGFDGECFYLPRGLPPESVKRAVIQIYRLAAKQIIADKVDRYARLMNARPSAVKINGAKTRWGSCSGKNNLNFSWRLIMAEDSVIDYVVVHELAHIREHNHSPRFWSIVADILPDHKRRAQGLKALRDKLSTEDWD